MFNIKGSNLVLVTSVILLTSCSNSSDFMAGDCIQKPDEVHKWKVLEKRSDESIVERHSKLGEKNQKRISNKDSWILTDC